MPNTLPLTEAAACIRTGELKSVDLVNACLRRIEEIEDRVHAWVRVDADGALATAEQCDAETGPTRPLHGVPIGVKDILFTDGLATEGGSAFLQGFISDYDATAVKRLREAGAVIIGKTVTTEFAGFTPADTRNPWNLDHTPGGSSSGTAAAVATHSVPAAIGTQTGGSISRPAAYCGTVGFKPTYGRVSLHGVLQIGYSIDHVGALARSVDDAAVVTRAMTGHDTGDPFSACHEDAFTNGEDKPVHRPRIGLPHGFFFDLADDAVREATEAACGVFKQGGGEITQVSLPKSFADVHQMHRLIMFAESAAYHEQRFSRKPEAFSQGLRAQIEEGLLLPAAAYAEARRHQVVFRRDLQACFRVVDVLVTPTTPSTAPEGLSSTGDPVFNIPWSYSGYPTVVIPVSLADDGLPIGIQLVARPFDEARLLAVARWCESLLGFDESPRL